MMMMNGVIERDGQREREQRASGGGTRPDNHPVSPLRRRRRHEFDSELKEPTSTATDRHPLVRVRPRTAVRCVDVRGEGMEHRARTPASERPCLAVLS